MSFLYAIQFSSGLVKIGRSENPARRIRQHAQRLAVAGSTVDRQHIGRCQDLASLAERLLQRRCMSAVGKQIPSEWFTGIDFDKVKTWLDEACASRTPAEDLLRGAAQRTPVHAAMAVLGGSPTAMAVAVGEPVKRQNVEHWLKSGRVPAEHAPSVEAATRRAGKPILCEELCPGPRWDVLRKRWRKSAAEAEGVQ